LSKSGFPSILLALTSYFSWKKIFYILAFPGLILLPLLSRDAGVSGDEEVHYLHSQKVLDYYTSFGKDTAALFTPQSHLAYYGQSFDNFTTLLINWFNIEDIYRFRHICNAIIGWLAILVAGFLVVFLSGYRAGVLTLLILCFSPRFVGHAFNNLKDIPFAFGYIVALYFLFRVIEGLPKPRFRYILLLILGIGLAISVRIGGAVLIFYLLLFTGLYLLSYFLKERRLVTARIVSRSFLVVILISVGGYLMGLLFWPYALENPIKNPMIAFRVMASFPTTLRQIFEGEYIWSDQLPWYYLLKYMLITIPTLAWMGFILFLFFMKGIMKSGRWIFIFFVFISFIFPVLFVIYKDSNLYGAWRHLLFVYPPLIILSGLGYEYLLTKYSARIVGIVVTIGFLMMTFHPARFMIRNHPYQYLYYNEWIGGLRGAYGMYETDYYFHSMREASEWLTHYLDEKEGHEQVTVAANFPVSRFFRDSESVDSVTFFKYYERGNVDWDYAIIGNSYIHPFQLRNEIWPPVNTLHTIKADGVPVCAILTRLSKDDLMGSRLLKAGEYTLAVQTLKKALTGDPQNESLHLNLALAYIKGGEMDSARKVLERVTTIYPDYDVALDLMAEIYLMENRIAMAKEVLTKNLAVNPKYFPSCYKLGEIYLDEKNDEMGIYYLRRCLRLNPDYTPLLLKLGKYYEEKGDREKAKKFFDRVSSN